MWLAVVFAVTILLGCLSPAQSCDLKLLLSWDVSASMSAPEYEIQRRGTAEAFRHPRIKNAIALSRGGIAVALLQWAGPDEQVVSVPWTLLRTGRDADSLANRIEAVQQPFGTLRGTAVGNGLNRAGKYLSEGPSGCMRTVVDISGDGATNAGIDTASQANLLERSGVTINGLVLPEKCHTAACDPYMFYVRNVARGPGSFVMDVDSYEDFPRSMRRKLIREINNGLAFAKIE